MLKVAVTFISIVVSNGSRPCGVPSRLTVRPPATPPPAMFTTTDSGPSACRGGDGCADGVVVEDVARDRHDPITELRGQGVGETGIAVEHHHAHAEAGQPAHGG